VGRVSVRPGADPVRNLRGGPDALYTSQCQSLARSGYDATAAREAAVVYPKFPNLTPPQLYDATGAREAAIVYANELGNLRPLVYDATGAMLAAIQPQTAMAISSIRFVYDATSAREAAIVYANELGNLHPWSTMPPEQCWKRLSPHLPIISHPVNGIARGIWIFLDHKEIARHMPGDFLYP